MATTEADAATTGPISDALILLSCEDKISDIVEIDRRGDLTLIVGAGLDNCARPKQFLVCSRTLARLSPVFASMLYGPFSEKGSNGSWTVELPEDNPSAFELLACIAHGYLSVVPKAMGLGDLFELAALTHYYDVSQMLNPWAISWLVAAQEQDSSNEVDRYRLLWIASEFGAKKLFEITARRILMESPIAADSNEEYPDQVSDIRRRIDNVRNETIQAMLDLFRDLISILIVVDEQPRWCRHASYMGPHRCESMILGSITFCLSRAGLWPIPKAVDVDESILSLHRKLAGIIVHDIGSEKKGNDHSECNPMRFLMDRLQRILADMPDPVLDEHRRRVELQAKKMRVPQTFVPAHPQ